MSEFAKVAHEWVRMCKAYSDDGDCMKCPLVHNPMCGCIADCGGASDKEIAKAEADIMAWAAEHPEPVYPTWYEVMAKFGVIDGRLGNKTLGEHVVDALIKKRISADTAQKLGIEPKGES